MPGDPRPTLLAAERSQLLIVDVQERLLPAMAAPDAVVAGCRTLLRAAGELAVPTLLSEQYPRGLGPTVAPVRDAAAGVSAVPKLAFSAWREPALAVPLRDRRAGGRDQVVVAGLEAHVCVLQSCIDLHEAGFAVACVTDAVSSRAAASVETAKARLLHAGIALVTVEMVVFEWLGQAGTPAFKTLSALLR